MKGGKREGAGRPKGKEFPARVYLTMTHEQKRKLLALGGSCWVRKQLASQICDAAQKGMK